jgi:hypothetical protein
MRNTLKLDMSGFERLLLKLDSVGGDVKAAVNDALTQAGQKIEKATIEALNKSNLPAQGKYSHGDTLRSVIRDASVEWDGNTVAWIPVGFDFSEPGAGGYLISGTPKMRPVYELQKIYKYKEFMKEISDGMEETINKYIDSAMEGRK